MLLRDVSSIRILQIFSEILRTHHYHHYTWCLQNRHACIRNSQLFQQILINSFVLSYNCFVCFRLSNFKNIQLSLKLNIDLNATNYNIVLNFSFYDYCVPRFEILVPSGKNLMQLSIWGRVLNVLSSLNKRFFLNFQRQVNNSTLLAIFSWEQVTFCH